MYCWDFFFSFCFKLISPFNLEDEHGVNYEQFQKKNLAPFNPNSSFSPGGLRRSYYTNTFCISEVFLFEHLNQILEN